MSTVALFMLKAPRPGFVKTRLAHTIGKEAACLAFRRMAEQQVATVPASWTLIVHFTPADALAEMQAWLGAKTSYVVQCEGDLGARMRAALEHAWAHGHQRAILLGGDCPWITGDLLLRAESALATHDTVLGPAHDGGYYLLGLNAHVPPPFEEIAWSTEHVLVQTLALLAERGQSAHLLPTLEDVDDFASWERAKHLV
jgi:uncharacterized protein